MNRVAQQKINYINVLVEERKKALKAGEHKRVSALTFDIHSRIKRVKRFIA